MAGMGFQEAYDTLMSASPYAHSTAAAMMRNFGATAQLMAAGLRDGGITANSDAGTSGAAAQQQAELRAQWFDQVAQNSQHAAQQMQALADAGNKHQTTAETVMASYQQAAAADTGNATGAQDMNVIHHMQSGSSQMNSAVDEWSGSYKSLSMPKAPPVPQTGGSSSGSTAGYTGHSGGGYTGGSSSTGSGGPSSASGGTLTSVGTGDQGATYTPPGSVPGVTVPPSGGDFAGWFHDPNTGYYVDPSTGREFDPVTSRWVDPVTGKPFGDATQYATSLQGLGGASTGGGLLADTGSSIGTGAGGFSALFGGGGNTAAVAASYGGFVPPSLATGSRGVGSLWQQAANSTAIKSRVAQSMLAREEAARTGRPYMPPTQAGGSGAGGSGAGGRRPGYLTAAEEESSLFSSRSSAAGRLRAGGAVAEGEEAMAARGAGARGGGRAGALAEEEGAGAAAGRRTYLPPTQANGGKDDKRARRERPDWLVDDDVFAPDGAPTGILGD